MKYIILKSVTEYYLKKGGLAINDWSFKWN